MRTYKARSGKQQWMASVHELEAMDADGEGLCLACGEVTQIEPDAHAGTCPACGEKKLFGAAELMLLGLTY